MAAPEVEREAPTSPLKHEEATCTMSKDRDAVPEGAIRGVLFSRSIRAHYAILHLACCDHESSEVKEGQHVVVRIQFEQQEQDKALRSWCRRLCKLGVLFLVQDGTWTSLGEGNASEWIQDRYVVRVLSIAQGNEKVHVIDMRCWNMGQCQLWQKKHLSVTNDNIREHKTARCSLDKKPSEREKKARLQNGDSPNQKNMDALSRVLPRHGGGLGKRVQGQHVTNFLIHIIMEKLRSEQSNSDKPTGTNVCPGSSIPVWDEKTHDENINLRRQAIIFLNTGSGVIDAAGGSGHVSMAMGLAGIQSTVVDPRASVGKLPKRDRKIWNKALKLDTASPPPPGASLSTKHNAVVPYSTRRAWIGKFPEGVDATFRQLDQDVVSYCGETHDSLIGRCSAIVALHPDEATDSVVDIAVERRIPFVIVPCCVFGRLFPHRKKVDSDQPVSTYDELLDYLMAKHSCIQASKLPFDGANVALWSTF